MFALLRDHHVPRNIQRQDAKTPRRQDIKEQKRIQREHPACSLGVLASWRSFWVANIEIILSLEGRPHEQNALLVRLSRSVPHLLHGVRGVGGDHEFRRDAAPIDRAWAGFIAGQQNADLLHAGDDDLFVSDRGPVRRDDGVWPPVSRQ